ncbi:MAG: hypothetical protein JSW07_07215 [bacterium]|nr:MAG: hypothetical protein JSW07_07215 [bacterium]
MMYHSNSLLVSITLIGFWFSNYPGSAQENFDKGFGLWVTVAIPNQPDSLTVPVSRQFITLSQIKSLPIHSIQLLDHKTKENITWEGVYLQEVFEKFLKLDWKTIYRLIIKATNGYSSAITGLRMPDAETAFCTFSMQGKEWKKKFGYLRIIFPDLHEMHWMNNPAEVELVLKSYANEQRTWKFLFFDSPVFASFQNNVGKETAEWSVNDILTSMDCARKMFAVFTGDGQVREYLFDNIAQKMKFASDSLGYWTIRGKRIPIGFRLRKIFFLHSENIGLFTKLLTSEEQLLWQNLFASIHPSISQGIHANKITLVLATGEKIPSGHFEAYQAGKISLYQLMRVERDAQRDLMGIEVRW